MSTAQKERLQSALVDQIEEKNRMAEWWRRNASVRHGVPFDEGKRKIAINLPQEPQPSQPLPQPQPVESKVPDWAKWVAASLLPLGAAGAGYWLANRPTPEPSPIVEEDKSGSLYQYLEDHGYHVPE